MLYTTFRVMMLIASSLGMLHMVSKGCYIYILFPISIIFWVIYSFFKENDDNYLRVNGIDPNEVSSFFPEQPNERYQRFYDPSRYTPKNRVSIDEYKKLKNKCKRNFKITISKETNDGESET